MNEDKKRGYQKLAHALEIIIKVLSSALIIGGAIALAAFIALLFVPESFFPKIFSLNKLDFSIYGVTLTVNNITLLEKDVRLLAGCGIIGIIVVVPLYYLFLRELKKLIVSFKNGTPFAEENPKLIKNIAVWVFVLSVAPNLSMTICAASIAKSGGLLQLFNANGEQLNLGFSFSLNTGMIIVGLVILLLGKLFEYGASLQKEHDTTL